jgi:enolase-phosphatase E1
MRIEAVVTDIEGTTTDIGFVHRVLFPYAARALPAHVAAHRAEPALQALLRDVAIQSGRPEASEAEVVDQLLEWIKLDLKLTPLKTLQGWIWREGYQRGDFTGHVYPDAVVGLRRWHAAGLRLYVYSSGSEEAQRLLFGHSDHGDLTGLFSGYFDTRIGAKRAADSYRHIAAAIAIAPERILFLSDIEAELDAARTAGLATCLLARGGETTSEHPLARDFHHIPQLQEIAP